ncbi:hypothetical protein FRC09_004364 [Ceratobasidium sp. 395]|nr:hypothetical protein FRC09_004364 [Ceratobasidium sp. 395]
MATSSTSTLGEILDYVTTRNIAYVLGALAVLKTAQLSYDPIQRMFSPLRHLPGPKNDSLIFGNLRRIFAAPALAVHEEWLEQYGSTYVYRIFFSACRLFTSDTRAMSYILTQSNDFPKPESLRRALANLLGEGILFAEFDTHKRQRRIMNPAFGPVQVRELVPIFWQKSNKANKLKDIWLNTIKSSPEETTTIDVLSWLSRATLDIIGVAGFDYHFNSLDGNDEDELAKAFSKIFEAGQQMTVFAILRNFIPLLQIIPDERTKITKNNMANMRRIGMKLVESKKEALAQELKTGSTAQGRDLLTLLIKSNMAYENEGQRMTDDEVLGQISTFLVAGHETTSTATTWALYALTKHPEAQRKLRKELIESSLGDEPSMADLDKLPYLDNVVRESLRVHPPVPSTIRVADHDVQVPVSKSFKDRYGVEQTHITVQKGDGIIIPIASMNRDKDIWGDDAREFRPERWDNLPESAKDMPAIWGHLMTFLAGNRSCIGFRFALIEMKALMYSLIRAIEFDINPDIEIEGKATIVIRPRVVSEPEKGNQMPLICKPVGPM